MAKVWNDNHPEWPEYFVQPGEDDDDYRSLFMWSVSTKYDDNMPYGTSRGMDTGVLLIQLI